jgi:hypothetical protein
MTNPGADAFTLSRQFIAPTNIAQLPSATQDWTAAVLATWDPVSYANTVVLGGQVTLVNLPVISPQSLAEGIVILAKVPSGYVIMGNMGSVRSPGFLDPIRYRYLPGDITLPNTTLIDAGILNFLLNTNTAYAIDGALFYTSTSSNDIKFAWDGPANMVTRWSMWGEFNTSTNGILIDTLASYGDGTTQVAKGQTVPPSAKPQAFFATTDTPGLLQLRVALNSGTTAGSLRQGSWLRISELGAFGGPNTIIKLYPATGSRSYDHNGAYIGAGDGDNFLYTWSLSGRSFGNEAHMWTFNAAQLRTDVAGATILSAQIFMYCVTGSSLPADLSWRWSVDSTIDTTFPNNGFGGGDVKNLWQANSWASFDISAQISNVISSNANSVLGGSYNFTDSASKFNGFGGSANLRPYLQVMYSI